MSDQVELSDQSEREQMRVALEAWGSWCHTQQHHESEAPLFEVAVELTASKFFPGSSGEYPTIEEHRANQDRIQELHQVFVDDMAKAELMDVISELLELMVPSQVAVYRRGIDADERARLKHEDERERVELEVRLFSRVVSQLGLDEAVGYTGSLRIITDDGHGSYDCQVTVNSLQFGVTLMEED